MMTDTFWGLPDPELQPEFYADIPAKRLLAWCVDAVLIFVLSLILVPFTAFTAIFFFPILWLLVGFAYRWITLARASATPGMRLMSIEIRSGDGSHLDTMQAGLHTLLFSIATASIFLQIASIVLMITGNRAQGLHDHLLGTAAINRAAAL